MGRTIGHEFYTMSNWVRCEQMKSELAHEAPAIFQELTVTSLPYGPRNNDPRNKNNHSTASFDPGGTSIYQSNMNYMKFSEFTLPSLLIVSSQSELLSFNVRIPFIWLNPFKKLLDGTEMVYSVSLPWFVYSLYYYKRQVVSNVQALNNWIVRRFIVVLDVYLRNTRPDINGCQDKSLESFLLGWDIIIGVVKVKATSSFVLAYNITCSLIERKKYEHALTSVYDFQKVAYQLFKLWCHGFHMEIGMKDCSWSSRVMFPLIFQSCDTNNLSMLKPTQNHLCTLDYNRLVFDPGNSCEIIEGSEPALFNQLITLLSFKGELNEILECFNTEVSKREHTKLLNAGEMQTTFVLCNCSSKLSGAKITAIDKEDKKCLFVNPIGMNAMRSYYLRNFELQGLDQRRAPSSFDCSTREGDDNLKKGEDDFYSKVKQREALQNIEIAPALVILGLDNDESPEEKWFPFEYNRKLDKLASYGANKYCSWLAYSLVTVGQGLRYFYIGASTTGYIFEKRVSLAIRFSKGVQYGYTTYKSPVGLMLLSEISLDEAVKYMCLLDAFFVTVGNKSVNSLFSASVVKAFLCASWTYTVACYEMGSNSPSSYVLMMQSRMDLLQQLTYLYYCSWHWYFCGCSILPATTNDMQPWFASIKQLILLQYCHWHWYFSGCSTIPATTTTYELNI